MMHRFLSMRTNCWNLIPFTLALCLAQSSAAQDRALQQDAPIKQTEREGAMGSTTAPSAFSKAVITHRIIDAPNGTFGYEILSDGKLFVRQTSIPGRPGVEGCATRQQAETLAALVAQKIRSGAMPPTVSAEELTSLGL
jgi:hypothetical protein